MNPESHLSAGRPVISDARWFAEEVQPHEPALRAFLRSRFSALADLDDLVQESYARLLQARRAGRVRNAKALLFVTARNVAIDVFRHKRVLTMEPLVSSDWLAVVEDRTNIPDTVANEQEYDMLLQAIDTLPERCRDAMILKKIHGLSNREIAERHGTSIHTVNAQLVLGLMRCREYLRARGVLRGQNP